MFRKKKPESPIVMPAPRNELRIGSELSPETIERMKAMAPTVESYKPKPNEYKAFQERMQLRVSQCIVEVQHLGKIVRGFDQSVQSFRNTQGEIQASIATMERKNREMDLKNTLHKLEDAVSRLHKADQKDTAKMSDVRKEFNGRLLNLSNTIKKIEHIAEPLKATDPRDKKILTLLERSEYGLRFCHMRDKLKVNPNLLTRSLKRLKARGVITHQDGVYRNMADWPGK